MQSHHRLWLVMTFGILMATALVFRLLTYDRYLPLLDYSDESNMFLLSTYMRADEVPLADDYGAAITGEWLAGYPPLYPWLGVWMQRTQEALTNQFLFPGDYIGLLRLISVIANLITVAVLYWLGWNLAHPLGKGWAVITAWFTALPYAISAQIVDVGNLAIPDSLIPLACAVALGAAVRAVITQRPIWLLWSLLGAIAAIYLKYSLLFALWPTFCAFVVLVRQRGIRTMFPWMLVLTVLSLLTAGYLIWGYGAFGLENQEAEGFRESGLQNMFSPERNWVNLSVALDVSTGIALFFITLIIGLGMFVIARRRKFTTVNMRWLWMLVPMILGNMLLTSSVVYASLERGGYGRIRFMFPAAIALSAIWALCIIQYLIMMKAHGAIGRYINAGVMGALTLIVMVPDVMANITLVRHYSPPDTNLLLWRYTDASLPPDGKILTARVSRTHKVWNRPYSGYDGSTTFEWIHDDNPARGTPTDAYESGISYFVLTDHDRSTVYNTPAMDEFINALWPLKTIEADGRNAVGETTYVYRMIPPQHNVEITFGHQILLVGYDLNQMQFAPGETLTFRPYWRSVQTPTANYSMFVHLYPRGNPSDVFAQYDGAPVSVARLPITWDDPDEQLIGPHVTLAIPEDTPPGDYVLAIGLYNFETGTRLSINQQPTMPDQFEIPVAVMTPN